jgi:hypothetical protein
VIVGAAPRQALEADPGFILRTGYTYSGHPAACAAGLANLDIIEREGLLAEATRIAERLGSGLRAIAADGDVDHIRGNGDGAVAAHLVSKQTGFRVIYGPVRAADLPAFLHSGQQASAAMRRVTFTLSERLILTPVELVMMNKVTVRVLLGLFLLGGIGPSFYSLGAMWQRGLAASAVYLAGLFAGAVLTPILLPWIPGAALAWKGGVIGLVTAILACGTLAGQLDPANSMALLLALPAVASYCAMNFTGSTTYTSPSGVEKEMRRAIPLQALAVLFAGVAWFWASFATSV